MFLLSLKSFRGSVLVRSNFEKKSSFRFIMMISEFGSKFPFGFLVSDSKRVIRISGFSGIPPGLVSIISSFWGQLKLIIPLRCLMGEETL